MKEYKKFFTISCGMFSFLITILAIGCTGDNQIIEPSQVFRLLGMSFALAAVTILRDILGKKQWMLRLSYFTKRLIFAPVYLAITLATLYKFGYPMNEFKEDVILIIIIFTVTFLICGGIKAYLNKRLVSSYMDDIKAYQKKLGEDSNEETK